MEADRLVVSFQGIVFLFHIVQFGLQDVHLLAQVLHLRLHSVVLVFGVVEVVGIVIQCHVVGFGAVGERACVLDDGPYFTAGTHCGHFLIQFSNLFI